MLSSPSVLRSKKLSCHKLSIWSIIQDPVAPRHTSAIETKVIIEQLQNKASNKYLACHTGFSLKDLIELALSSS